MTYTFKGGIRPDDHKYTKNCAVERVSDPDVVSIALTQHIGVMCRPLVKVGDHVLEGQLIGDIPGGLGCPVHSSVSGDVQKIEEVTTSWGGTSYNIVIKNDGMHTLSDEVHPFGKKLSEASFEEITAAVRHAGIAGMGGTAFPTHAKLSAAKGKAECVIVNCCECEPFACANHRIILENCDAVVGGVKIIMMALGIREAWIAVGSDKRDEISVLEKAVGDSRLLSVKRITPKYPAGSEKHLICALTGKEIPEGQTPVNAGYVVFNAETCMAIFEAFAKGMPLINRVVTVDGDCVAKPANLLVPIGTPVSHLIAQCGGLCADAKKIILGGPMMGQAQWDPNTPVTKNTSAVLVFSKYFDRESKLPAACIRCGRCVSACPMRLMPLKIAELAQKGKMSQCEALGAASCMECGSCTYVCPGGVPVSQLVGKAKTYILSERRNARSGK